MTELTQLCIFQPSFFPLPSYFFAGESSRQVGR